MANVPKSLSEIDSFITQLQHLLSNAPLSDSRRPKYFLCLASERLYRHTLLNQREDLDKAIVHSTDLILLPPSSWSQHRLITLRALFLLAYVLLERSKVSRPEDVIYAIKYFSHLRDQPHEISDTPRHEVTALLVDALALRVELKAGNVMQSIREMAVLTREALTLDLPDVDTTSLISLIYGVLGNIHPGIPVPADRPLDELIECLRAARKHKPDLLKGRLALAISLASRYEMTFVNDDYEEAAAVLDEIITYSPPGNSQDEFVAKAQVCATGMAALLAMARSDAYKTPEYLEEEIYRTRACSNSSSFKERHPSLVFDVEASAEQRFRYFGSIDGVKEFSRNLPISLLEPETLGKQISDKMMDLLDVIRNIDDSTMIDEVIEKGRSLLASCPDPLNLELFGVLLEKATLPTNKIEYLNESISIRRQLLETPPSHTMCSIFSSSLFRALLDRFHRFPGHRTQDLDEGLELLSQCVGDAHWEVSLLERFRSACQWAHVARHNRHPSVSTAYKTAMSLMQDTPLFSPTLQLKHSTLAGVHHATRIMPLDYASYQIGLGQFEKAIETLEQGRALLWSEMRHLRTPIDQLLEADSDLAHKFSVVNRELEELTKSVPPSHKLSMDDGATDHLRAVDPFGRLVLKQRDLLKERTKLISHIQALPGFDTFLASPSFDTLRSAVSSGPVIIINHSVWRSDILVLLHNMPPSLIPTPGNFYGRACALRKVLLDRRRKYGLYSEDYDEILAFVLADLYKLVGKPVIDRLHQLKVPEQSRIWWCPTSVFCSLPIHAMGPVPGPSDDGEPRYFSDLYICSYTPTLSALTQSRHHNTASRASSRPSILLVAQPDSSLLAVRAEIQIIEALDTKVTSLISEAATPATVIYAFHRHGFVHFACHGALEPGKPFEGGFELYGDVRLTLLEIVRAHLPAAEFAFLSACHTAEVTEGSITDEGLHLAAAVQFCGFRSVVGTMWEMADIDGRDLAKYFYKALFSDSESREMLYHERSAKALRFAVKMLRRKRGITLERWVNYVHYGA